MKILVSGASGLIGSALVPALEQEGHHVARLVRRGARSDNELSWDPQQRIDTAVLGRFDAVVHLAARTIGTRWTEKIKHEARESRLKYTCNIAESVAASFRLFRKPDTLISAAAIGYYGSRGDEVLTEASSAGVGFLAELAREWEQATQAAASAGVRVVLPRISMVLSKTGGGLPKMLLPFRVGLGGPIGSGRQWMSWITLDDVVAGLRFALSTTSLAGPVNFTAPNPVTNREFVKALGAALHRPAALPLPAFAVRLLMGEMGDSLLLGSARVVPATLERVGFKFQHPELREAFGAILQ